MTYTDRNLRFLLDSVGAEHVVFDTNWPAPSVVPDPVRRLARSAVLSDDQRAAILSYNTTRLLGA